MEVLFRNITFQCKTMQMLLYCKKHKIYLKYSE